MDEIFWLTPQKEDLIQNSLNLKETHFVSKLITEQKFDDYEYIFLKLMSLLDLFY